LSSPHLAQTSAPGARGCGVPPSRRRPRKLEGFLLERGRLAVPGEQFFADDPVRLIQLFALADRHELEIHPLAMRAAARQARLIDAGVRQDFRANALFLEVLASPRDPATVLRWMNEAGVFGRFIPDFGRVVAQMQFDMYHHYTVDEHSIRAIGLLSRIEKGELKEEHPLSTGLMKKISSRRALYVAVLLHDIAKGRGGDHSELGADIARDLCPRLGLADSLVGRSNECTYPLEVLDRPVVTAARIDPREDVRIPGFPAPRPQPLEHLRHRRLGVDP
jgi:[protein-PII] uridylyltransferase